MHDNLSAVQNDTSSRMLMSMTPPTAPHLLTQFDHVDSVTAFGSRGNPSPISMPPAKRPKLSLQTSALSTSYRGPSVASGNRVDRMATATPTTLNTHANTFELSLRPSPSSASASPANFHPRAKSRSSSPFHKERAYDVSLPFGVKPILKNSTLTDEYYRGSKSSTASPRVGRKVFFPAPKKVSFRPVLEDEIVTHIYTARHVDLSPWEDEAGSSVNETPQGGKSDEAASNSNDRTSDKLAEDATEAEAPEATALTTRSSGSQNADNEERDQERGRSCRKRSISSQRSKRKKRRWEWTLEAHERRGSEGIKVTPTADNSGQKQDIEVAAGDGNDPSSTGDEPAGLRSYMQDKDNQEQVESSIKSVDAGSSSPRESEDSQSNG